MEYCEEIVDFTLAISLAKLRCEFESCLEFHLEHRSIANERNVTGFVFHVEQRRLSVEQKKYPWLQDETVRV
jgi:hypothetical protein